MAAVDLNEEWLGHVQPVGLVVAPVVLARHGLNPETQTRADSEEVRKLLSSQEDGASAKNREPRALRDDWAFFEKILGWRTSLVAGAPGGLPVPEELSLRIDESDTEIAPHWAVAEPDGSWQILVRIEASGIGPEKRGAIEGWEASPHQRLERLLREKEVPIGLLVTDAELRFIYAPRGETSGWMSFPLRSLGEVGGRPMLGGLKLLLSSFRLYNDAPNRRLPALLKASRDAQAEVSTKLASQVLGALHELLRGLHAADAGRIEALAATRQEHLYDGLLTVLLRLVFLLYAEDRDLIPSRTDAAARAFYDQGYGIRTLYARLLDDKAHYPDTMDERRGAWPRLLALFRLVHQGDSTGNWIRGRGGKLFDTAEFPFLQGQERTSDPPTPAAVSDGCILRILDLLLNLGGEKLSYRTLDVEQIGSVYETVMGFTIETRTGPALALRAGKNDRIPVFVDVAALAAKKGPDRAKFLKEKAGRNSLSDKVSKALSAAANTTAVVEALTSILDERGSPGGTLSPPGSPLLQPTQERRRTGSHYTPRALTAPIVQYALEPTFERLGPDARPEEVLGLKVCDPAMGSGAFLVEACRALGERLVKAWDRWPETRPKIPEDEDDQLHARRLVAQRCLYGVDKNPRAVDLAKLSLWLATLARDHEFTFLDHALKCGDSLVGLTTSQIAAANWDESKPGLPLFRQLVRDKVERAMHGRAAIQSAPDDTQRDIQEARHRNLESEIAPIRMMGDAVISAFFEANKAKAREKARALVESYISGMTPRWDLLRAVVDTLRSGERGVIPFHWQVEFPEVFARDNDGFDAIVGNPPFLGGTRIATELTKQYVEYLKNQFSGAGDRADLVSYFFRQSFGLLRYDGLFGLIASNTISQGDTRKAGLKAILDSDGRIVRAIRRYRWPGEAAVVVSIVHIRKGETLNYVLDHKAVPTITCFLLSSGPNENPHTLIENAGGAFEGMVPYSDGFMAVGNRPTSQRYLGSWVFPFARGKTVNSVPDSSPKDFVVFFKDREFSQIEAIDLLEEVRLAVHADRGERSEEIASSPWWLFWRSRMRLWNIIERRNSILVRTRVSPHHAIVRYSTPVVPDTSLVVFPFEDDARFAVLQSRAHELWARFFASSMKDDLRYTPSDCFRTFPFPKTVAIDPTLEAAGKSYHSFRAKLMIDRNEGLTKIYNRFHARGENAADIASLRRLHADMDAAVFRAYGWHDMVDRTVPEFIEQDVDEGKTPKTRLDWSTEFKDEVLARLLALNSERATAERAAGLTIPVVEDEEETDIEELDV